MFSIRPMLCKWGIQIVYFWLNKADLSPLMNKQNQVPTVVESEGVNKQGIV